MRISRFLFLPLFVAAITSGQGRIGAAPVFEHDALSCMSSDDFPVVEAVVGSAELEMLRRAQVYFKASEADAWYFVEMERGQGTRLQAVLPKPLLETEQVDYYLFFLSSTFEPAQSAEFSVPVSETACAGVPKAASISPVSVTLRATVANQAPVPPGFGPQGISGLITTTGSTVTVGSAAAGAGGAASGGVSGVAIGAVAGGAAAAAAVAVVATSGDAEADSSTIAPTPDQGPPSGAAPTLPSPSPSPPPPTSPAPTPPPASSLPDVSGTWFLDDQVTASCAPELLGRTSRTGMVIQQNGTALTASRNGPNFTENLTGAIDAAGNLVLNGPFVDEDESGESNWEASVASDSKMSGHYTRFYPQHSCTIRWRFTGSKS